MTREPQRPFSGLESLGLGVQVIEANKIVFSFELCLLLPTEIALAGKLLNTVKEMFVKLVSQNYEA